MSSETTDPVHGGEAERWGGWTWRAPDEGTHFRTCSYCGSIHPDDLADAHVPARWADFKYGWPHKAYVDIPSRNPEQPFVIGSTTSDKPTGATGWVRAAEAPEGTIGWGDWRERDTWVLVGTRPTHHAKFYTVHLADTAISSETKEQFQAALGLRFHFVDGRVSWEPFEVTA